MPVFSNNARADTFLHKLNMVNNKKQKVLHLNPEFNTYLT